MVGYDQSCYCYREDSNPTSLHEPPCGIYFILDTANFKTFRNSTRVETEITIVGTTSHRTTNLVRYHIIWMVYVEYSIIANLHTLILASFEHSSPQHSRFSIIDHSKSLDTNISLRGSVGRVILVALLHIVASQSGNSEGGALIVFTSITGQIEGNNFSVGLLGIIKHRWKKVGASAAKIDKCGGRGRDNRGCDKIRI